MWSRQRLLLAALIVTAAVTSGAQSIEQGFPPLAGVTIAALSQTEIDQVLAELRDLGRTERLTLSEGRFPKQGRDVVQIKLERDLQTFFYLDNFRDAKRLQLTAYSHAPKNVWHPIWSRLVEKLTATVGSQRVSDAFEY
jgi:hypothetical protein